jgi:hypothetical protein
MPKTLKSVSKGYAYNINYKIDPIRLESIIRLLEDSRDYLSKAYAVHIVITLENNDFDVSLINKTIKKVLNKMNTRLWFLYSKRIYRR